MHQLVLVSIRKDEEVLDGGNVMMEKGLFPCKLIFFDGADSMKLQSREKKTVVCQRIVIQWQKWSWLFGLYLMCFWWAVVVV